MTPGSSLFVLAPLIRALGFIQMIEEGLRVYVGTAEELIAAASPYGIPFQVDRKLIEGAALGKLITMFVKLNRNEDLHTRLRELVKHRNYIAHAGFRRSIVGAGSGNEDLEYMESHAQSVGDESEKILSILAQELASLMLNFPNSKTAQARHAAKDTEV